MDRREERWCGQEDRWKRVQQARKALGKGQWKGKTKKAQGRTVSAPIGLVEVRVVFDGGCRGNGGHHAQGYGSFEVDGAVHRRAFASEGGCPMTSNVAEMLTAIEALRWLTLQWGGATRTLSVHLWGDSQLAVHCLAGRWRVKKPHLKPLVQQWGEMARVFGSVQLHWHRRAQSVAVLGH